jgi:hypothetical protein
MRRSKGAKTITFIHYYYYFETRKKEEEKQKIYIHYYKEIVGYDCV